MKIDVQMKRTIDSVTLTLDAAEFKALTELLFNRNCWKDGIVHSNPGLYNLYERRLSSISYQIQSQDLPI